MEGGRTMPLEQRLEQSQKLILSQTMRQALLLLQLPLQDLDKYLQEASLSNPVLEVEHSSDTCPYPDSATVERDVETPPEYQEHSIWDKAKSADKTVDFTDFFSSPQTFSEHLTEQLGQIKDLDPYTLARCRYLVDCLNPMGYLEFSLIDLAKETGQSLPAMEQALTIVQSLDPIGSGARTLSECLLLQLANTADFTEVNIRLIQTGLPLVAKNDLAGLAKLLGVKPAEVRLGMQVIRRLNPIPSRGFYAVVDSSYIQPEATIRCEDGQVFVDMNDHVLPQVTLNPEYCALLGKADCRDAQPYLREKLAEAKNLMASLQNRSDTISRLISTVIVMQKAYFLNGAPLKPMTMKQVADALGLNHSTVSRAVKDKFIQFHGAVFPLRRFFTAALQATDGTVTSAAAAKEQIRHFVAAENPGKPLSDEVLGEALAGVGIILSRRTVAKYRTELGIPVASSRKHK
jgi:RNA polymerase sigma-54 factor